MLVHGRTRGQRSCGLSRERCQWTLQRRRRRRSGVIRSASAWQDLERQASGAGTRQLLLGQTEPDLGLVRALPACQPDAAIESRLLMGAMTAKYRPDGFLYYSLSIWNQNKPIESGPFTDWNPVSWTTYHGDGSLLCSGPGGKPVPTIRLEKRSLMAQM